MVQVRVVEDDEPRILEQVGPHEVVAAGVPELVDDQIVGSLLVQPDEVVGGAGGEVSCAREGELGGRRDEHIHLVRGEDAGSASTEYCATPLVTGGSGVNQASRTAGSYDGARVVQLGSAMTDELVCAARALRLLHRDRASRLRTSCHTSR